MNTLTHTLNSSTLSTVASAFETGRTSLTIDFSGIHDSGTGYFKFVTDFGDGSDEAVVQDNTNTWGLSAKTLNHIFYPSSEKITSYIVSVSGFRTDLTTDLYQLDLRIGKPAISSYKDIKIINSYLFTSPAGKNNLALTIECQSPHFVGNMVIPYEKVDLASIYGTADILQELDLDVHLRTEIYSAVGGMQSIVRESSKAYIVRESDLIVMIIGNELGRSWSGHTGLSAESIALVIDDSVTIYDINGDAVADPALILIPEFDTPASDGNAVEDYSQKAGLAYRL